MLFLTLSILSSASILILFKFIERFKVSIFQSIILNYITATFIGFVISPVEITFDNTISQNWIWISFAMGVLLLIMFNIIGISTQRVGITITSIASKMSVVIPITFSILYYNENTGLLKIMAIIIALAAILMSAAGSDNKKGNSFIFPMLLFIGIGAIDLMMKFSQSEFINSSNLPLFSASCFGFAGLTGLLYSLFKKGLLKQLINYRTILWGIGLGLCNYGSMYFLIKALEYSNIESSIVFGINNLGILIISLLAAVFIFREPINKLNRAGIILSFIAIIIFTFV
jgi:drug/metabolite transporter (DMT)-like permease